MLVLFPFSPHSSPKGNKKQSREKTGKEGIKHEQEKFKEGFEVAPLYESQSAL